MPTVHGLMDVFDVSLQEVGEVIVKVPQLLSLNWKANLMPKALFLQRRLGADKAQLKSLLQSTPRIFVHSVSGSLAPKIEMLDTKS